MATRPHLTMTATGPLFAPGRAGKIIRDAAQGAVKEAIDKAGEHLSEMLRPRSGGGVYKNPSEVRPEQRSTGNFRNRVVASKRIGNLTARIDDGNVIYGPWLEGVSSRNRTTHFKGYSMFRRTKQWIEKQRPKIVEAHMKKAVRDLG